MRGSVERTRNEVHSLCYYYSTRENPLCDALRYFLILIGSNDMLHHVQGSPKEQRSDAVDHIHF